MARSSPVEIRTEALVLRQCLPSDSAAVYEAVRESIAELSQWFRWCHPEYSLQDAKTWIQSRPEAWESGTDYDFVILDATDDRFVGSCAINHIQQEHRFANLGYWVRTTRTGQGIASTVVPLVARFGFEELELTRIEIVIAMENLPSQRVAEKVGAQREGVLRRRLTVGDKVYDAVMFSVVPGDL